jgi:hypothetical protein
MTEIIETTNGIQCQTCGTINWPTALACMNCTATLERRPARKVLFPTLGRMSYSQKVARFFEITDYLLLIPATMGLLYSLALFPVLPMIVGSWYAAGCLLLHGFFRHSRGRLSDKGVTMLWLATIGYNLVDLVLTLKAADGSRDSIFYLFTLWPLLVIILSASALLKEKQAGQSFSYDR